MRIKREHTEEQKRCAAHANVFGAASTLSSCGFSAPALAGRGAREYDKKMRVGSET